MDAQFAMDLHEEAIRAVGGRDDVESIQVVPNQTKARLEILAVMEDGERIGTQVREMDMIVGESDKVIDLAVDRLRRQVEAHAA